MPVQSIARITPRRAWLRVIVGLAVGGAGVLASSTFCSTAVMLLIGWTVGGLAMLIMAWAVIGTASPRETRERAASQDPGRRVVYALVLLTSATSLFAAVALAKHASFVEPRETTLVVYLCLATVAISWALTHTAFTLRYAHLYYRDDDEGVGGIEFPGTKEVCYFDFAYFAFTLGMCFQVSDMLVSSSQVRRTVLMHALLSFAYNTAILALALNLAFGSLG